MVNHLRIIAIKWTNNEDDQCLLYSSHTGRRMWEYASSVGIPFLFQETYLEGLEDVVSQEGELVIVNCIWKLPHMFNLRNRSQLLEFLIATCHLNPVVVTTVFFSKIIPFVKNIFLFVHGYFRSLSFASSRHSIQRPQVFVWKNEKINIGSSTYLFLTGLQFLTYHKDFTIS